MLDANNPARRKRTAIADAVDLVDDRNRRIAGPQEISMQGMDGPWSATVRCAATSACPITCPPNTRCQPVFGLRPRNRLCSSGSRSRMSSSSSNGVRSSHRSGWSCERIGSISWLRIIDHWRTHPARASKQGKHHGQDMRISRLPDRRWRVCRSVGRCRAKGVCPASERMLVDAAPKMPCSRTSGRQPSPPRPAAC